MPVLAKQKSKMLCVKMCPQMEFFQKNSIISQAHITHHPAAYRHPSHYIVGNVTWKGFSIKIYQKNSIILQKGCVPGKPEKVAKN